MAYDPSRIRLFVEEDLDSGVRISLRPEQVHYLRNVMRQNTRDHIFVFNGRHGEWRANITELGRKSGALILADQLRGQTAPSDLWLIFAPVKRIRLDFIGQKATELGVSVIQPVFTERTIVSRVNGERLRANAVEAAEQCWCLSVPEIRSPMKLGDLLNEWPSQRRLIMCDEDGGLPLPQAISAGEGCGDQWAVLVGPEGGFSSAERTELAKIPALTRVSLGPRILRADTAAIAVLSVWQALQGDWYT